MIRIGHFNPLKCLQQMQNYIIYKTSDDYIMAKIEEYLKMNLDQGRRVMVTFVPRDKEKGNTQADGYGKPTEISVDFTLIIIV